MSTRTVSIASAVWCVLAISPPAALTVALADNFIGGEGGSQFGEINCPRGQAVVGLGGRSGLVLDTFQILCGKANGGPDVLDPRRIGPSNGGSPVGAVCPPLHVARGIQIDAREFNGQIVISQLTLTCELKSGEGRSRVTLGQGGGDDAGSSECPVNTFIAGFAGRSGLFIDAVGISVCRKVRALN